MTDTINAPVSEGTRMRDGTKTDRKITMAQTQASTSAIGGGAIVLTYLSACLHARTMIPPTLEEAAGILIVCGPFLHLLVRIVMYWTGRLLPKDAETDN